MLLQVRWHHGKTWGGIWRQEGRVWLAQIPPLRFVADWIATHAMLRTLLLALVALTTSLKLPPPAIGRRAAVCLLPACLFAPQIAEAKYRASLAEMKGYGSSPYVDQMKGT